MSWFVTVSYLFVQTREHVQNNIMLGNYKILNFKSLSSQINQNQKTYEKNSQDINSEVRT